MYRVIVLDPESIGATQVTVARPGPLAATTFCGGEGATPLPLGTCNNRLGEPVRVSDNLLALTDAKVIVWIDVELSERLVPQIAATAPATCGLAIDVTLRVAVLPSSHVDKMKLPGAKRSTQVP